MNLKQIFEVQSNDSANPSFFCDYDTGELLYLNQAMEKKFQIFEDYTGKKACDIIPDFHDICGYDEKKEVVEGELTERTIYSEVLGLNLRTKVIFSQMCGRNFLQTKYFIAPNNPRRQDADHLFERAIGLCLEILGDNTLTSPVDAFLDVLGTFYSAEKVFICEFDRENHRLLNRHFWTAVPHKENIDPHNSLVKLDNLIQWLSTDFSKSVINLDNTQYGLGDFHPDHNILDQYRLDNVTLSKLWNKDGTLMGFIGLANREESLFDDRLLQAISHFVMEQFNHTSMMEALEDFTEVDLLTGFYNRKKYTERLEEIKNCPPMNLGVIFVNMNGLRETNEFLGYEEGDLLLKRTSSLLIEYFNSNFYRVTGDEFIGFVEDCDKSIFEETVYSLQDRLKASKKEPSFAFGHCWESGNYSVKNMIKVADSVMLINKQSYYHETFKDTARITDAMLKDLFQGIAEDEFIVYLQPQVDLKTEKVVGAEALIRRFDKKKGKMVYPDQFIPNYENNGIIRHIDLFVVRKTCQLLKEWKSHGMQLPISVNLSRVTLMEHGIVQSISDILNEYEIPSHLIIIEITERMGIVENEVASSLVDDFKEKGFKLSLDDFGSAYSNIVTLASVSVDEVKLDKSLVDNVLNNEKNAVIVRSLLSMCQQFKNTHTLAEGIETKEQAEFLHDANCDLGQGYLYSQPIPSDEFFNKYVFGKQENEQS